MMSSFNKGTPLPTFKSRNFGGAGIQVKLRADLQSVKKRTENAD
ncbi:hypothetical protein CHCC20335_2193 [Bacillus paralicheniformis]|nr:hypothetical protein CHCC20335_2193 [Bacillus paralicheniformis]